MRARERRPGGKENVPRQSRPLFLWLFPLWPKEPLPTGESPLLHPVLLLQPPCGLVETATGPQGPASSPGRRPLPVSCHYPTTGTPKQNSSSDGSHCFPVQCAQPLWLSRPVRVVPPGTVNPSLPRHPSWSPKLPAPPLPLPPGWGHCFPAVGPRVEFLERDSTPPVSFSLAPLPVGSRSPACFQKKRNSVLFFRKTEL